jgi:3-deoxy-D-manno-octulosonic-acid transferase
MTILGFIIYNLFVAPFLFIGAHLLAIFNRKLRKGVWGRYLIYVQLRGQKKAFKGKPVIVFHCASMGEFEHIKPFLIEFKKIKPEYFTIVLFFSPSGYDNVKHFSEVDSFLYSPFDWILPIWRFMKTVKPSLWVDVKHDVWPNQVWFSKIFDIPVFLINASLLKQSTRLLWFIKSFHQTYYRYFTKIFTVSSNDYKNFSRLVSKDKLKIVGDTKYDQVIFRRDESMKMELIPKVVTRDKWVFIAGSTWPEDHEHIFKAIKNLRKKYENFLTIICPHEPTEIHLQEVLENFGNNEIILFSDISNYKGESIILINTVGVLANLYGKGKAAFIGGSFKQNIHNVLEAAVYKIPIIFGPVNKYSYEAQLLKANGGGLEVENALEIENRLNKFILNDVYRQEAGLKAFQIVQENKGATSLMVESLLSHLK